MRERRGNVMDSQEGEYKGQGGNERRKRKGTEEGIKKGKRGKD